MKKIVIMSLIAFAVVGCSVRKQETGSCSASSDRNVSAQVEVLTAAFKVARPRASAAEVEKYSKARRAEAPMKLRESAAMSAEAARRGISVTEEDRAAAKKAFASRTLRSRVSYAEFAKTLTPDGRHALESGVDSDILAYKVASAVKAETRVCVSDQDAADKFAELAAYNERAAAEEKEIRDAAKAVWSETLKTGDLAAAMSKAAGLKSEYDPDWGELDAKFFSDSPEVVAFLASAEAGSISEPVDGDGGLLILRVKDKTRADASSGAPERYSLEKAFFFLPETYPLTTKEALAKEMSDMMSEDAFNAKIREIVAAPK